MDKLKKKKRACPVRGRLSKIAVNSNGGFSIVELMIALAIMSLVLTAVILVSFGNQSFLIGTQTSTEAMKKAQGLIEKAQAYARKDFNLVNATSSIEVEASGFKWTKDVTVVNYQDPDTNIINYFIKKVTATVGWEDERKISRNQELITLIANFDGAVGGNTCNSTPQGNWASVVKNSISLPGNYPVSGIDAYLNRLYATSGNTSGNSEANTFFIFDLSSPGFPSLISGSAIDTSSGTSAKGPNALKIISPAKLSSIEVQKTYAFLANGVTPSSWTCTEGPSCSQFQVIDVSSLPPISIKNLKLGMTIVVNNVEYPVLGIASSTSLTVATPISSANATSTYKYILGKGDSIIGPGTISNSADSTTITGVGTSFLSTFDLGSGESIFYKNGYVFLGLDGTGNGSEFNIIDVYNPTSPQLIKSYTIGNGIEAIYVSGNFAYLATLWQDGNSLMVLDISNLMSPIQVWPNPVPPSSGFGNALALVGDILYFGMTSNTLLPLVPEFFTLNNPNPTSQPPSVVAAESLKLNKSVGGIIIRDYLRNILISNESLLKIYNTKDSSTYDISLPGNGTAIDCQGNFLYVGDGGGNITSITAN